MEDSLDQLLDDFGRYRKMPPEAQARCRRQAARICPSTIEEVIRLLDSLVAIAEPVHVGSVANGRNTSLGSLFDAAAEGVWTCYQSEPPPWVGHLDTSAIEHLGELYRRLEPGTSSRWRWLRLLAAERSEAALRHFADLMVVDPPREEDAVVLSLSPLLASEPFNPAGLFPRLLEALAHPHAAAPVLDLCNFFAREGRLDQHPAHRRAAELAELLGRLAGELQLLEENPDRWIGTPAERSTRMAQSVALYISLCDALALIGDESLVGKLYQALEIGHRRLRTEAAAALARLGEETGVEVLVSLLEEPIARPRAMQFLEEVGSSSRIPERFRSAVSNVEGDLALWLAQPAQFGVAPASLELIETRHLRWPGYEAAVECHLFRFALGPIQHDVTGFAIAGPVTWALAADLSDLPPDDIFAAFAGWHAAHEEIYECEPDRLSEDEQSLAGQILSRASGEGYSALELSKLGYFFGQTHVVATANRAGSAGVIVADEQATHWYPAGATRRPLGATEAYYIHKGRSILRTFNS